MNTDDQTITVTITDVNDNTPVITSNAGGDTAAINVAENATAVTTVTSTDGDAGATATYSLNGGADAGLFNIDAATGVLTMTAQDFETPAHVGNTLEVIVRVSDGVNTDDQTITVTITDVDDTAPTVLSVTSNATNGRYIAGNVIDIQVTFSEIVNVAGIPTLALSTGVEGRTANYLSGSGTTVLTFRYVVQQGDRSLDLQYLGITSLDAISLTPLTYNPAGPQRNVAKSTVTGGGWVLCYSGTYSLDVTVTELQQACTGSKLMLAGGTTGSADLLLLATGDRSAIFTPTGVNATTLNNGTYFYFNQDNSMGFASVADILQNSADVQASGLFGGSAFDATSPFRLSWHLQGGNMNGGWRLGSLVELNESTDYTRYIYEWAGVQVNDAAGNILVATLPDTSSVNSLGGSKAIDVDATAPSGLIVTPGAGSLTISVTDPSWSPSMYTFEVSSDNGGTWLSIVSVQRSVTIGGLTAGTGYRVRVSGLATVPNIALVNASQSVSGAHVTSGNTEYVPTSVAGPAGPAGPAGGAGAQGVAGAAAVNPQSPMLLVFSNSSVAATLTMTATLTGGSGSGAIAYSSTDEKICTVSTLGVVTGVKVGECAIVATKAASAGYLEAKSNPVIVKVTDSPADLAAAKAKADADAAAAVKAKADADAAAKAAADKAAADAKALADKALADLKAAADKAAADAKALADKAAADAKALADKALADLKAAADKAAADAKAIADKAAADAKAAADKAAADAKAAADKAIADAKAASEGGGGAAIDASTLNSIKYLISGKSTKITLDLADKYSGLVVDISIGTQVVVKGKKVTKYVKISAVELNSTGKAVVTTKVAIKRGSIIRVSRGGFTLKTLTIK